MQQLSDFLVPVYGCATGKRRTLKPLTDAEFERANISVSAVRQIRQKQAAALAETAPKTPTFAGIPNWASFSALTPGKRRASDNDDET